nr:MAG TPA: hypothetical protein [Caudoviricetes sp.]
MPQNKKFIITQDKSMSNILIAHGFRLLSNICGTYTFVNQTAEKFNFDSVDTAKLYFTNNISL